MTIQLDFNTKSSSTVGRISFRISFQKMFENITVLIVLQENQWFIKFVTVASPC